MKQLFTFIIIAGLAIAPAVSQAQDTTKTAKTKMERRRAMKEKWDKASPEQKEKMKEKGKEMKAKYDSLPPEKQKELRDKMKARKEAKKAAGTK